MWVISVVLVSVGEVEFRANDINFGFLVEPGFSDSGVDKWSFESRVAA